MATTTVVAGVNAEFHHARERPVVYIEQFRPALELQSLCRIAGLPHRVTNSRYPSYASTGELPQLRCGSVLVGGVKAATWMRQARPALAPSQRFPFVAHAGPRMPDPTRHTLLTSALFRAPYVQRFAADVDSALSSSDESTATALLDVLHGTLTDVAQWCWNSTAGDGGGDAAARDAAAALALPARQMSAPLSWIVPRHLRTRALAVLMARGFGDASWVEHEVRCVRRRRVYCMVCARPCLVPQQASPQIAPLPHARRRQRARTPRWAPS